MNVTSFFKPSLIALAIFSLGTAQASFSQTTIISQTNKEKTLNNGSRPQGSPDLALVDCKAVWGAPGQVAITWTVRNIGKAVCQLEDIKGENLVSYIVEASKKDPSLSVASDWVQVSERSPLVSLIKDLRPGATATGNFTFESDSKEGFVCYRVTLNTENIGGVEINKENNIYIGRIPAKQ